MGERVPVTPENCPEPSWHETHHFCPCCTWTNPNAPKSDKRRLQEAVAVKEGLRASGDHVAEALRARHDHPDYQADCLACDALISWDYARLADGRVFP